MKILIAGLGNIGEKYKNTRHNIGFKVADELASRFDVDFALERLAYKTYFRYAGKTYVVIKPTTFMNLSGKAIKHWLAVEKIPVSNLLVIVDDIAFPFGVIKIKPKGSHGGHNGLADIERALGTTVYPRIRFGIGNDFPYGKQIDYVLGEWTLAEQKMLPELISRTADIAIDFGKIGLENTMNKYNTK